MRFTNYFNAIYKLFVHLENGNSLSNLQENQLVANI